MKSEEIIRFKKIAGLLREDVQQFDFSSNSNYFDTVNKKYYKYIITPFKYLKNKGSDEAEYYDQEDIDEMPSFEDFVEAVKFVNNTSPTLIYNLKIGQLKTGFTGQSTKDHNELVYDLHDGYYLFKEDYYDNYAVMKKKNYESMLRELEMGIGNSDKGDMSNFSFSNNE